MVFTDTRVLLGPAVIGATTAARFETQAWTSKCNLSGCKATGHLPASSLTYCVELFTWHRGNTDTLVKKGNKHLVWKDGTKCHAFSPTVSLRCCCCLYPEWGQYGAFVWLQWPNSLRHTWCSVNWTNTRKQQRSSVTKLSHRRRLQLKVESHWKYCCQETCHGLHFLLVFTGFYWLTSRLTHTQCSLLYNLNTTYKTCF